MKLAALLLLLLPRPPITAQALPPQALQHGLSQGAQAINLFGEGQGTICPVANANGQIRNLFAISGANAADGGAAAGPAGACAQFEIWVENLGADFSESVVGGFGAVLSDGGKTTIQRFVRDNLRLVYASYSMTVEKLPVAGAYRATFADSTAAPPTELRPRGDWKLVSPAAYPVPQILRDGDEIPIELFQSSKGAKLVDYVRAGSPGMLKRRAAAPRDSYAGDAEFTIAQPRLRVNGAAPKSAVLPETLHSAVLWIYVPGLGRYLLTLEPHPDLGFERAGEVSGNGMTLLAAGNVLRIDCQDRIAAGGGAYNVYARGDQGWVPTDPAERERFLIGTSPAVETVNGR